MTPLINRFSDFAMEVGPAMLSYLWQITVLIIFAAIASYALRKRGPGIRLTLWIAVITVIPLIPFVVQMVEFGNMPTIQLSILPPSNHVPATSTEAKGVTAPSMSPEQHPVSQHPQVAVNRYVILLLIYLIGAAVLTGKIVLATIQLGRWTKTGTLLSSGMIVELTNRYCRQFDIKQQIRVIKHHDVAVPCTAGIWRPVIFIPESYDDLLSNDQIPDILCHECAHIKRHDVGILTIAAIIRALFWIHPLIWAVYRQIAILTEQSADELVLDSGTNPAAYATMLTNIVQLNALNKRTLLSPVGFIDFKHTFLDRVRAILTYTKGDTMTRRSYVMLAMALMFMVGAAGIVPLTERGASAALTQDDELTFNLVVKDSETNEPIRDLEMSIWYFNTDKFNEETNNYSYLIEESVTDQNGRISFKKLDELDPSVEQIIISRDNDNEYPLCTIEPNIFLFKNFLSFGRQYERSLNLDRTKITSGNTYTVYMEPALKIHGVVVDPDGNPVEGATVDAIPAYMKGTGGNSLTGDCRYRNTTDNFGRFTIYLPDKDMDVVLIAHDGSIEEWRTWANGMSTAINLKNHNNEEDVTIRLTRPGAITGIVRDANGNPVADMSVSIKYPDGKYNRYYIPRATTDENGLFRLNHVRAGEMLVLVDHDHVNTYHPDKCEWPEGYLVPVSLFEGQNIDNIELLGLTYDEVSKVEQNNFEKSRGGFLWFKGNGFTSLW